MTHRPTRHDERDLGHNVGTVITSRLIDTVVKSFPSQNKKRGDQELQKAREIAQEFGDVISQSDHQITEERITL